MKTHLLAPLVLALASAALFHARGSEPSVLPNTLMTVRGKLLLAEDFSRPVTFAERTGRDPETWTDGWRVKQGAWAHVDGAIRGVARRKVYPAGTLHVPLAYRDAVIQVDVRLDAIPLDDPVDDQAPQSAGIVLREADASHIGSLRIRPNGFSVKKDRTSGRIVNGKPVTDEEIIFGKYDAAIAPGTWHTALIEVRGQEILVTLDGRNPLHGVHPIIGLAKGVLNFGTSRSASFRNLRVWEALPNPEWQENKRALARNPTPREQRE